MRLTAGFAGRCRSAGSRPSTGFPYATIWRHVVAAERGGIVRQVPGGYVLADQWIDSAETSERSRTKIRHVRRLLDLAPARLV